MSERMTNKRDTANLLYTTTSGQIFLPDFEETEAEREENAGKRKITHNVIIEHIPVPAPEPKFPFDEKFVLKCKASNDWVQLRIEEMVPSLLDVGENIEEALRLKRLHQDLMDRLASKQENIEELLAQADRLVSEQPEPEAAVYEAMAESLGTAWKDLNKQLQLRGHLLDDAIAFFTSVQKHADQMDGLDRHLRQDVPRADTQDAVQRLLKQHDDLRKAMLDTAAHAMELGNTTIAKLRQMGPFADNPERPRETLEACQKIENIMLTLHERRKRVEITWEDRRIQLEWGLEASNLWRDLRLVEEWLLNRERESQRTDLGASDPEAEQLYKDVETFYQEAKQNHGTTMRVYYMAEQLASNGYQEGEPLLQRCEVLRRRMDDLINRLEMRRQLLHASGHFFRAATSALLQLNSLESEIQATGSDTMPRKPEDLARRHAELASRLHEISGPTIAQGRALLERVSRDDPGARGIVQKVSELEHTVQALDKLCSAHRAQALEKSRQLQSLETEYHQLHMWMLNVAEAFMANYRDMGTTYAAAVDFVQKHKQLATEISNKETDIMKLFDRSKDLSGQPGEPQYQELSRRITDFSNRWESLKQVFERRIQLGTIYQQFHKSAVELSTDVDTLEAMIKTNRDVIDPGTQKQFDEFWASMTQNFNKMKREADKFMGECRLNQDTGVDIQRAQLCVDTLIEHFSQRHKMLEQMWNEWKQRSVEVKKFQEAWEQFQFECLETLEWLKKLEQEAIVAFGRFEDAPNVVAEKHQRALDEFMPIAKKAQGEIEKRLRTAEMLQPKGDMRQEREKLIDELLAANQRFQQVVTWFEVICSMSVTFFRNLHQLDEWTKRIEEKFSLDQLPKDDATRMEQLVREHEAARQTVSQMIKFAHTEGDQIIGRSRQSDVPNEVHREAQKLPDLINNRIKRWEEVWTKQHKHLEQFSGAAKLQHDLNELMNTVRQLDGRLVSMRQQVTSSPQAAHLVTQEYREFERTVNLTDQRVTSFISMVNTGPYRSHQVLKEHTDELNKRWLEFRVKLENFQKTMQTAAEYFMLIEQTEVWIKETTEYITDIGRRAQTCSSSEEANRLMGQLEQYMKPRQREQEERMKRLQAAAVILHGEEAEHRIQHIQKKYKEIVDSFVLVSDNLFTMAETCRAMEAKKLLEAMQKPPKFTQPLKDGQVIEGKRFEFMCRVSGEPEPEIVWYKDGIPIINNPDYETSYLNTVCVLKIEETFTEDSAVFTCRATNPAGSAETQARLVVKESPLLHMQPPDFTKKLANATGNEGEPFAFECHVTGNPAPAVSWYKNEHSVDLAPSCKPSFVNGVCKLSIEKTMQHDEARYTCRASNPAGQAATSATLTVATKAEPPVFAKLLVPQTIETGDRLVLECHVSGKPQPQLTWMVENQELRDSREVRLSYDGFRASLTMNEVVPESSGTFRVIARNQAGEATSACSVTVQPKPVKMETSESEVEGQKPRFIQELRTITVTEETIARLDCVIVGIPEPEVIWFKEDQPVRESEHVQLLFQGDKCSLMLSKARLQDAGLYKCTARNAMGETSSFCRLIVQPAVKPLPTQPPRILPLLQNQVLTAGQRCMFEARVTGEPEPDITWEHEDKAVITSNEFQILKDDNGWHRLVITRVTPDHAGTFSIKGTNVAGESKSVATLTVNPPVPVKPVTPVRDLTGSYLTSTTQVVEEFYAESHTGVSPSATPPEFVKPFAEEYQAPIGQRARLDCLLIGNPRPKVTWLFNGRPIANGFCQMANVGDTYAIIIPQVRHEHKGIYTIKAENIRGDTECTTRLVVISAPPEIERGPAPTTASHVVSSQYTAKTLQQGQKALITGPPAVKVVGPSGQAPHFHHTLVSVVCVEGDEARFEASVSGMPSPEVTWQKDGLPLSSTGHPEMKFSNVGGKITLVISNAKIAHSGKYLCTAKNDGGFATSSAQLVVRAQTNAPDFAQRLISREVMEGESMRWEVKIVGDPIPAVTWLRNGMPIPHCPDVQLLDEGNGHHVLLIPKVEQADAGQFTVRAENIAGEARSTADLVVRPKGMKAGQYFHVTRVTQEQQEVGLEVSRDSKYEQNNQQPAVKAPRI